MHVLSVCCMFASSAPAWLLLSLGGLRGLSKRVGSGSLAGMLETLLRQSVPKVSLPPTSIPATFVGLPDGGGTKGQLSWPQVPPCLGIARS